MVTAWPLNINLIAGDNMQGVKCHKHLMGQVNGPHNFNNWMVNDPMVENAFDKTLPPNLIPGDHTQRVTYHKN